MKRVRIAALLMSALLFAGCRQPVSLTDRAVVKMICVAGQPQDYRVQLVAYTAAEGGTESSEKKTLLISGGGETVKTALIDAQQQLREQLFYAQNELLLVEETTAAGSLSEILRFFSEERSSRPNMAVFAYRAAEEGALLDTEGVEAVVDALEEMKDGDGPERSLTQMIYRFDLAGRSQDFFLLPRLAAAEDGPVKTDALLLLQQGQPTLALTGEEKQLAELLLGGADRFRYDAGEQSCTLTNPRLTIQVEQDTAQLTVSLVGEVKDLSLQNDPGQLEQALTDRLQQTFSQLYQRCYLERGIDLFRFGWHFLQWDAATYAPLIRQKTLFGENTVRFDPKVTVVA
ncbi:MAG TPA: hypothetical protein H9896_00665 [Candidatus Pygmaiobacter gallistercoris]|nr:hypothetical protein [Candidatus Pygmaiobacter gallistercoris]